MDTPESTTSVDSVSDAEASAVLKAVCDKEIDEAHTTINKNQDEYDKQLLTLSSGFLALSLAFIKDVVPLDRAIHKEWLFASFVILVICVSVVLISYQISNQGLFKAKAYWEDKKADESKTHADKKNTKFPYGYAYFVRGMNIASGLIFFLGIVLTVCFVITNLKQETTVSDKPGRANDGQFIKVPAPSDLQRGQNIKAPQPPPKPPPPPPPPSNPKK